MNGVWEDMGQWFMAALFAGSTVGLVLRAIAVVVRSIRKA